MEETKKEIAEEETEEVVEDLTEPSLEEEIDTLQKEVARLKNAYALAYADTENLKKRLQAEAEAARKYRIQSFALEILPVLDNLERALAQEIPEASKGFYEGVKMTYDQLVKALKNEGVEEIDCLGKPFDANYEQALFSEKASDSESGIVLEVLQKGYLLKDRILRPSLVKVSE